jgi:hypothetical protein
MADFKTVNEIYGKRFPNDPPARATFAAGHLSNLQLNLSRFVTETIQRTLPNALTSSRKVDECLPLLRGQDPAPQRARRDRLHRIPGLSSLTLDTPPRCFITLIYILWTSTSPYVLDDADFPSFAIKIILIIE